MRSRLIDFTVILILICGIATCAHAAAYVVFQHNNVQLVDASHVPGPGDAATNLKCDMARGEYEPIQIGVHAVTNGVKNLTLEVDSDLDVRIFRRIDEEVRAKLGSMPNPMPGMNFNMCLDESNVIGEVKQGSSEFFWVVFHAKPDARPGQHLGKVRISSNLAGTESVTELGLVVRVRPFILQRARIAYFPYYYIKWTHSVPGFARSDTWIRAIFRDLAEHGHTSVTFEGYPGPIIDLKEQLPPASNPYMSKLLPMCREVGLSSPDVPLVVMPIRLGGPEGGDDDPSTLEQKNKGAAWLKEECRRQNWPELIRYGHDEPGYPPGISPQHVEVLREFRDVGMRLGTAMYSDAAYGLSDLHDIWIVSAGEITPEMSAEAKRLGAEVWSYTCHTFPIHSIRSRFFAGLYTWVHELQGNTFWHYYAQGPYKFVWMRQTDSGPMPTVWWETRRDGIDDYRYLQMLEDSIAANPGEPAAAEAGEWLASLRKRLIGVDPHLIEHTLARDEPLALEEYDQITSRAADYIEQLGPVVAHKKVEPGQPDAREWPDSLKDEAKLFRGKPLEDCIKGLGSINASERRAAAWALYEMGPDAAPATRALAGQLNDPEVRMPALRALEAIGPGASAAVPEIKRLFSHDDGYVRLGATFALGGIGAPWKEGWFRTHEQYERADKEAARSKPLSLSQRKVVAEALVAGFTDEVPWVAKTAMANLARMGTAAEPALSAAIRLLDRPNVDFVWQAEAVRKVIVAIGPEAGAAVPKLVEILKEKTPSSGTAFNEVMALAAIGPAATNAVPAIENYLTAVTGRGPSARDKLYLGMSYYALFRIRGETADLKSMVDVLADGNHWYWVARFLCALGVKAEPMTARVREMIEQGESGKYKGKLEFFLKKVENGDGPIAVTGW